MARTYRNKSTVPHGWVVRDDGVAYFNSCCPNKKSLREKRICCCNKGPPTFRTRWTRKEKKAYRKEHWQSYRAKVKNAMHHAKQSGDWDSLPRYRRTSGWITW